MTAVFPFNLFWCIFRMLAMLKHLMDPLQTFLYHSFGKFIFSVDEQEALWEDLVELQETRDQITLRQLYNVDVHNKQLKWKSKVEKFENEASSIILDCKKRYTILDYNVNLWANFRLKKRTEKALAQAISFKQKASTFTDLADDSIPDRSVKLENPATTVGMEKIFEELKQDATSDRVNIIGVCGMGGVGKTTLLRRLNNHLGGMVTDLNMIITVELSTESPEEDIRECLGSRLKLTWRLESSEQDKAADINRVLRRLKFVLLLDNLWEPLDLQLLGIPVPEPRSKSKIIFATRLEDVCSRMGAKRVKVECLQDNEALDLFASSAKMDLANTKASIVAEAKVLTKMCGGLPPALDTVAKAMAHKKSPKEWKHAITVMKDAPFNLPDMDKRVLQTLKLSYDRLPSDQLKLCASYLSQLSEEHQFTSKHLCNFWISEGIVDKFKNAGDADNMTEHLLGELVAASLVERIDDEFLKIHPMNRAMLLWIARYLGKKEIKSPVEALAVENWSEAERISLGGNDISSLPEAPRCAKLQFLDLQDNKLLKKIPSDFFSHMAELRILQLQRTSIPELPASVGKLVGLQYLDLSYTGIRSLPEDFRDLVNLKYLALIEATCLQNIPHQVISSLQGLHWLNMYSSYSGWRAVGQSVEEGVLVEELEKLKCLKVLGITISKVDALQGVSRSMIAASTHFLHIKGLLNLRRFDLSSNNYIGKNMRNVLQMRLDKMNNLQEVILGGGQSKESTTDLSNLEHLHLSNLPKAKLLGRNLCHENLKTLQVVNCPVLKHLIQLDSGEREGDDSKTVIVFPNLNRIVLQRLHKLTGFAGDGQKLEFPLLETIEVDDCPELKKLELVGVKLKAVKCKEKWWDGLQWDDDCIPFRPSIFVKS